MEVSLDRLELAAGEWAISGLQGGFSADLERAMLGIGLQADDTDRPFRLGMRLAWSRQFAGSLDGHRIEEIEVVLGTDRVGGNGCLLNASPPALYLDLSAESIDLDGWRSWALGLRTSTAAANPVAATPDAPSPAGGAELPIDVSLVLEAGRATFRGATAEGIRLGVGSQAECPDLL